MTGTVSAYNQVQKIPELSGNGTATNATPPYIVPAGKKAKVTVTYQYIAAGANANTQLLVGTAAIRTLVAGDLGKTFTDVFQLAAGEDFHWHGNVADNSTLNFTWSALELPV